MYKTRQPMYRKIQSLVRPLCYRNNQTKTPHFTEVFLVKLRYRTLGAA